MAVWAVQGEAVAYAQTFPADGTSPHGCSSAETTGCAKDSGC